jgi:hypothetical protein
MINETAIAVNQQPPNLEQFSLKWSVPSPNKDGNGGGGKREDSKPKPRLTHLRNSPHIESQTIFSKKKVGLVVSSVQRIYQYSLLLDSPCRTQYVISVRRLDSVLDF